MSDNQEPNLGYTEVLGQESTNPSTPRTVGDTIFALGKEWTVSSCEMRIRAQFESWVRRNAKRAITEAELEDGPEEAEAQRAAFIASRGAGHYSWDGRYCRNARGDLPGIRHLLFLLLRRCHPDITENTVESIFKEAPRDCGMALRWALGATTQPSSQANLSQSNEDREGNGQAPGGSNTGDLIKRLKSTGMSEEQIQKALAEITERNQQLAIREKMRTEKNKTQPMPLQTLDED